MYGLSEIDPIRLSRVLRFTLAYERKLRHIEILSLRSWPFVAKLSPQSYCTRVFYLIIFICQ